MKREHVAPAGPRKSDDPDVIEEVAAAETDAALLTDIDGLLDEIDAVLEEQAVLMTFRQRSGQ
jgi:hypothetical protein